MSAQTTLLLLLVQAHVAPEEETIVSAGQRGLDVRLTVADLVRVTGATFVEATTPPA